MGRPTNKEAYARLLVLKSVIVHAMTTPPQEMIAQLSAKWSEKDREQFGRDMRRQSEEIIKHLKEIGAWSYASPKEIKFLQSYGPGMDWNYHITATWRKECAIVLMWALGLRENWPNIDLEADSTIVKAVPVIKIGFTGSYPNLKPDQELKEKRDLIEAWHWRVRTRRLIEEGRSFPADEKLKKAGFNSYDDIVRFSARNHFKDGDLSEIQDEEFIFLGKPFRDLNVIEYQLASDIISERHYAMNWLCGMAPGNRWDETPTPT